MWNAPISVDLHLSEGQLDILTIRLADLVAGQAVIRYAASTALVTAEVNLKQTAHGADSLDNVHMEVAAELMAFVLGRGATPRAQEGIVTYYLEPGTYLRALPSLAVVGLGHPNSC